MRVLGASLAFEAHLRPPRCFSTGPVIVRLAGMAIERVRCLTLKPGTAPNMLGSEESSTPVVIHVQYVTSVERRCIRSLQTHRLGGLARRVPDSSLVRGDDGNVMRAHALD